MSRLLLAVLLLALPAAAADDEFDFRILHCDPAKGLCIVPMTDLDLLMRSNNANYERAARVEAELAKLKAIKGCAKLEVTEPSKAPPPKVEIKPDPKSFKRG